MNFEVLKRSHLKRNIIIGVVAVLIISAIILNFTRARYRVTQSIPLVNGTINYSLADLNIVALYIDGVVADELDSTKSYTLDTTQSTCTYKDGSTIDNLTLNYDSSTKAFAIAPYTTKGTKCTLYFDKVQSASDTITNLYPDNQDILTYDDYNNLRYIGANPNNYVLFNDELWRIIGVFSEDTHGISGEKLVKLIRSDSLGNIAWDDSTYTNDWTTASLQTTLNNDYLNGSGKYASTGIISDSARNMIEIVTWKIGSSSSGRTLTSDFYTFERNTSNIWIGKVALMYPSDFGYATSGGTTTNRETCLAKELGNWNLASDCYNNDWLYNDNEWTILPGNEVYFVFNIESGHIYLDADGVGELRGIHPTVYLTSSVAISGGTGTSTDPYILTLA